MTILSLVYPRPNHVRRLDTMCGAISRLEDGMVLVTQSGSLVHPDLIIRRPDRDPFDEPLPFSSHVFIRWEKTKTWWIHQCSHFESVLLNFDQFLERDTPVNGWVTFSLKDLAGDHHRVMGIVHTPVRGESSDLVLSIVTRESTGIVQEVHDRQPVALSLLDWSRSAAVA